MVCYEDEAIIQDVAADMLSGQIQPKGKLPVTICESMPSGTGIHLDRCRLHLELLRAFPLLHYKRWILLPMMPLRSRPHPAVWYSLAQNGKIVYHKAYGYQTYDSTRPMSLETIFDMASVTKICATTISVMKLYDQGKLRAGKNTG